MTDSPKTLEKGHQGGECNRTACENFPATWFNLYTQAWYCQSCARKINASTYPQAICELRS